MHSPRLSTGDFGDEVARVHEELAKHGLKASTDEQKRKFFGPTTREAVGKFQTAYGISSSCEVCEKTAALLAARPSAAVAASPGGKLAPLAKVPADERRLPDPLGTAAPRQPAPPPVASAADTCSEQPTQFQHFIVKGHVRRADASPYRGGTVRLLSKYLRGDESVAGEATTDNCGYYEIGFRSELFRCATIIRVFTPTDQELVASPVIFEFPPVAIVDLVVGAEEYREPSEYERHIADLKPYLADRKGQEIPMASLDVKDITLLAGRTRVVDLRHIAFLVVAAKHAKQLEDETRNGARLPPEVFYGLFRQGLPTKLTAVLFQRPRRQREALEISLREKLIPTSLADDLDRILETLQALIGKYVLRAQHGGSFGLGDLLNTSGLPQAVQEKFISIWLRHEGSRKNFWAAVQQDSDFQRKGWADNLKFTMQMGLLTQNNIPLVTSLQGLRRTGTIQTSRDLAKLKATDWERMITTAKDDKGIHFPPGNHGETEKERIGHYANAIIEMLKDLFPTDYVFQGISEEPCLDAAAIRKLLEQNPNFDPRAPLPDNFKWGDLTAPDRETANASLDALRREIRMFPELDYKAFLSRQKDRNPVRKDLSRFFANAPEFDFQDTHIDTFLGKEGKKAFAGIEGKEGVTTQLKRLQRVYLVAPRYEHMQALMGAGLHSSFAIARVPLKKFVKDIGALLGGETNAISIHSAAAQKRAMNMHITASVYQEFFDYKPAAICGGKKCLK